MGKVIVPALIENLGDLENASDGRLTAEQVRRIDVPDALVDSGATGLFLPQRMIAQLGLKKFRTRRARGIGGEVEMSYYGTVRLTVQGRDCPMDVGAVDDELPVIIGQIPLESMDWVIDMRNQKLIGNPAHGGEQIIEIY